MTDAANKTENTTAAPAAPVKDERNGVTRPKDANGATGKVWAIADKLSASLERPATRGEVLAEGQKQGVNPATITTQYGRWCKYYGLKNTSAAVQQAAKDAKAKEKADAKAKADADKAAKKAEADKAKKEKADKAAADKKAKADAAAAAKASKAQVTPPPPAPAQ